MVMQLQYFVNLNLIFLHVVYLYTTSKEWERLSGIPIEEQTYERNREAVDKLGATVVLKTRYRNLL